MNGYNDEALLLTYRWQGYVILTEKQGQKQTDEQEALFSLLLGIDFSRSKRK
jgi:hypothetical protein